MFVDFAGDVLQLWSGKAGCRYGGGDDEYEGDDDGVYECGEYDGPVLSYSYSYGNGCPSAMPTIALSAASRTSAPALLCVCAALVAGAAALPF